LVRLLVEKKLPVPLDWCIDLGVEWYESSAPQKSLAQVMGARMRTRAAESNERDASVAAIGYVTRVFPANCRTLVADFIYDRLRGYLRDLGYTANQIAAVVDGAPADIHLVPARLAAVQSFEALPESGALAAANKRIVNILKKSESEAATAVDRGRLEDGAEHDLWLAFQKLEPAVDADCRRGDFSAALKALATAKPAVDRFFDDVMVMADDPAIRANRLALLRGIASTMNRVADISKLAV
jgi:glycyl-tRNA synthetase beta chain